MKEDKDIKSIQVIMKKPKFSMAFEFVEESIDEGVLKKLLKKGL